MNKHIKNSLQWLLGHALTFFSCVAIIAFGMGAIAYSSTSTIIGENISTNGTLSVSSNSTLATTTISGGDLTVDTDTLFVDSINNRVGIGTTSPSYNLDIHGNNSGQGVVNIRVSAFGGHYLGQRSSGTFSNPGVPPSDHVLVALAGGGYNGLNWVDQMGQISIKTNGIWTTTSNPTKITFETTPEGNISKVERMTIKNDGNVGIGITNPTGLLHVSSSTPSLDLLKITAGSNDVVINSSGNVGIGTTSPAYKLDVNGAVRANDYYSGDYFQGLTSDIVVKGSDGNDCTLTFKDGLLTADTCP